MFPLLTLFCGVGRFVPFRPSNGDSPGGLGGGPHREGLEHPLDGPQLRLGPWGVGLGQVINLISP